MNEDFLKTNAMFKNTTLLFLIIIFLLMACHNSTEKNSTNPFRNDDTSSVVNFEKKIDSITIEALHEKTQEQIEEESRMTFLISELKEVKEAMKYVEEKSKDNRRLLIWIFETPDENKEGRYWIKLIEDNGLSLVTWMNFKINPKTENIKYLDPVLGEFIELSEWRKNK